MGVYRDALNATGRPILFSICEWGIDEPEVWAPRVGNTWRTSPDISNSWASVLRNLDSVTGLGQFAGPGGWNDPDMLEVRPCSRAFAAVPLQPCLCSRGEGFSVAVVRTVTGLGQFAGPGGWNNPDMLEVRACNCSLRLGCAGLSNWLGRGAGASLTCLRCGLAAVSWGAST